MYLRYMQLDLPYREKPEILKEVMAENNCTYEEAYTIDYDNNWISNWVTMCPSKGSGTSEKMEK